MKSIYRLFLTVTTVTLGLVSCSTNAYEDNNLPNLEQGRKISAVSTIAPIVETRTSYEWNAIANTLISAWNSTEEASLVVIQDNRNSGKFMGEAKEGTCIFTGTIPEEATSDQVRLVYPAFTNNTWIDFSNQTQNGNGSTDHLKNYDLMIGEFSKDFTTVLFTRQTAVIKLNISGLFELNDKNLTKITLSSNNEIFYKKAALNTSNSTEFTNTLTLNLTNASITDGSFVAYITVPFATTIPQGSTLTTSVYYTPDGGGDAQPYTSTHTIENTDVVLQAGKSYTLAEKWFFMDIQLKDGVYEIYTAKGLQAFAAIVNGVTTTTFWDSLVAKDNTGNPLDAPTAANNNANAKLMDDIDLSSVCGSTIGSWTPISTTEKVFKGIFDGNGKVISNLYINATTQYQGLFGYTTDSSFLNITLKDASVTSTLSYTGTLVGYGIKAKIYNCHSIDGNVFIKIKYGGGLIGRLSNSTLVGCYASGSVTGSESIGGLLGHSANNSNIIACYTNSVVSAEKDGGSLLGYHNSTIIGCITTGNVGTNGIGNNDNGIITDCYSNVTGNELNGIEHIGTSGKNSINLMNIAIYSFYSNNPNYTDTKYCWRVGTSSEGNRPQMYLPD